MVVDRVREVVGRQPDGLVGGPAADGPSVASRGTDPLPRSPFRPRSCLVGEYVAALGGSEQSTVVGFGGPRVPEANAALANATSSHADEIDGSHVTEGHPGASVVATALSVAEARQRTGAELLSAIVLGYDIGTRLALSSVS